MIHEGNPCKKCGCTQRYSNSSGSCVECQRVYNAERQLNFEYIEKKHVYQAKYRLDPKHHAIARAYKINARLDPEYYEKRRVYNRAYFKTMWGKTNNCVNAQRYLAKKLALPNSFTVAEWQQCLSYWNYKCAYCGSTDNLAMEHFIPLASKSEPCPGTVKENIVPACKNCNSSKYNKSPHDWATQETLKCIETYFVSIKE